MPLNPGAAIFGTRVTDDDAPAWMMLPKLPRFWSRLKAAADVSVSGVGSPGWMARVSVKVNDPPGATSPLPLASWMGMAAMASASKLPSRVSLKESLELLGSRTRLGLSVELVLVTVNVYVMTWLGFEVVAGEAVSVM